MTKIARIWPVIALILAFCVGPLARSQEFDLSGFDFGTGGGEERDPVSVAAQFTTATAERPALLMVTATIEPEWHVYSLTQPKGGPLATKVRVNESEDYSVIGRFRSYPEPESRVDDRVWQGLTIEEHADQVTWYVPIEIAEGVDAESLTIEGRVTLQACKEACIKLDFDFAAKLGEGVPVGPIDTSPADPEVTRTAEPASPESDIPATPPDAAGVYRAEGSVVTWYGWLGAESAEAGGRAKLYLRAELPDDWHLNQYAKTDQSEGNKPTLIALEPTSGLKFYQPETGAELIEMSSPVAGFGTLRYHEGTPTWVVPIDVQTEAARGEYELSGLIGFQACESKENGLGSCELSKGVAFTAALQVGDGASDSPATVSFEPATYSAAAKLAEKVAPNLESTQPGSDALKIIEFAEAKGVSNIGLISMLGAALVGGLILNLMPCVLPVIGLKIMAFAKQGGESRFRVFTLNLTYVAGLLTVFLLLATLASLTQLGIGSDDFDWGELNTQTWFKVSMTALVFAMALSFLGVWEIPLPGFAGSSTAAALASREGYGGAYFKGVLTTILATPCSGPFLGPVFGYTIGQSAQMTYLIFLFVGLGMSLPYLLIGAFPALVSWIPKPGAWMETFKQLMAFVLLGTVVYLLSTINTDSLIPTLALLVAIWFACWLGGRQPVTAPLARRSIAWMLGLTTAVGVGLVGFAPERETQLAWKDYSPASLAAAQANGRTVLVDFTADWCLTCQWNLATALDVADVQSVVEANQVEALKADWTDEDKTIEAALMQLRSRSIPLLAIYPADRPGEVIVLRDTVSKDQVLQALAEAGATESNPQRSYVRSRSGESSVARSDALVGVR